MIIATTSLCYLATRLAAVRVAMAAGFRGIAAVLKELAPYAAIELILPGGTLVALLLWLVRRQRKVRAVTRADEADSGVVPGCAPKLSS